MRFLDKLFGRTIDKFEIGDKVYLKDRLGFSRKDPTGGEWEVTDITRIGYRVHRGCHTLFMSVWDKDLVGVEEYQSLGDSTSKVKMELE